MLLVDSFLSAEFLTAQSSAPPLIFPLSEIEPDSLDTLVLLHVTEILASRQMLERRHESLGGGHSCRIGEMVGLGGSRSSLMLAVVQAHIVILCLGGVVPRVEHFL